jgi:hypothetical protein
MKNIKLKIIANILFIISLYIGLITLELKCFSKFSDDIQAYEIVKNSVKRHKTKNNIPYYTLSYNEENFKTHQVTAVLNNDSTDVEYYVDGIYDETGFWKDRLLPQNRKHLNYIESCIKSGTTPDIRGFFTFLFGCWTFFLGPFLSFVVLFYSTEYFINKIHCLKIDYKKEKTLNNTNNINIFQKNKTNINIKKFFGYE